MTLLDCMTHTTDEVLANLDLILDALKIEYHQGRGRFFFPCPIHGSDNYSSLSLYNSGNWMCFTRQCHKNFEYGIYGFISAVKKCSRNESIEFCRDVLNGKINTLKVKSELKPIDYRKTLVPRDVVINGINSNVEFYLRRGYSKEILEKYDLFICSKKTSHLYGRVIFPVYDVDRQNAIGFVGRTMCPQCGTCKKYHLKTRPCPKTSYELVSCEKWLNSRGFARNSTLFNYWFAKDYIRQSGEAILVEGKGDVLKLEMAEIHNSLGIFGTAFTKFQEKLLVESGAKRLYIATDSDVAGTEAYNELSARLSNSFEIRRLAPTAKDFGDMSVVEIKNYFNNVGV